MRSVQEACAAGTFSWGGDAWLMSLQQMPGIIALASVLARDQESGARELNGATLMPASLMNKHMGDTMSTEAVSGAISLIASVTENFLAPPVRGMGV